MLYPALDIGFTVFHTSLILFNLFGWAWKPTRLANLITLTLTAASWFILGLIYGIGYCPLTDWHWQIKHHLGQEVPNSYLKWMFDAALGTDMPPMLADGLALAGLLFAAVASIYLNWRDWKSSP